MDEKHPVGMCRLVEKRSPLFPHPVGMRPWVTCLHEPGHLLGLVSPDFLFGTSGKHNRQSVIDYNNPQTIPVTPYIMNTLQLDPRIRLNDGYHDPYDGEFKPAQFKELNKEYLKFILPTSNSGT